MTASTKGWVTLGLLIFFLSTFSRSKAKALTPGEVIRGGYVDIRRANAVLKLATSVGFPDPKMATAIACAESRCNPRAIGDGGTSFGLWQIHRSAHPWATDLFNPESNARAALRISKGGTDWSHWSTFKSGAYRRFLNNL